MKKIIQEFLLGEYPKTPQQIIRAITFINLTLPQKQEQNGRYKNSI